MTNINVCVYNVELPLNHPEKREKIRFEAKCSKEKNVTDQSHIFHLLLNKQIEYSEFKAM